MFIVLEGLDGCGKTTQAQMLADWFREQGREVVLTREPGSTPLGEKIRHMLEFDSTSAEVTKSLLFAAARAELVSKVIRPALERDAVVISDRFVESNVAYQGYGAGLNLYLLERVHVFGSGGLRPDMVVFIDVPPVMAFKRRGVTLGESKDLYSRIYRGYLEMAQRERDTWICIDGRRSVAQTFENIVNALPVEVRSYV